MDHEQVLDRAFGLLTKFKGAAPPAMVLALKSKDSDRLLPLLVLREIGLDDQSIVPLLCELLKDKHKAIRSEAAGALARMGAKAKAAQGALLGMLDDGGEEDRHAAVDALVAMGPEGEAALKTLIKALNDPSWSVRESVCRALAQMGKDVTPAVPALLHALRDTSSDVRREAACTLGRMRMTGPEARPVAEAFERLLEDGDESVARLAAFTLLEMGSVSRAAIRTLLKALRDNDPETRRQAFKALKEYSDQDDDQPRE